MAYRRVRKKSTTSKHGYSTTTYNLKTGKTTKSSSTVSYVSPTSKVTRTVSRTGDGPIREYITTNTNGLIERRCLTAGKSQRDTTFDFVDKVKSKKREPKVEYHGNGLWELIKIFLFLFGILIVVGLFQ